MVKLLGARDMGLQTVWRFGFVGPGTSAETTPGVVYVDVGGSVKPGVLDHHNDLAFGACSSELVYRRTDLVYNHLLSDWLRRHDEGAIEPGTQWTPMLVAHTDPDWDTIVAAFLVARLVEEGGFPDYAEALVGYSRDVDHGRYVTGPTRSPALFAPHLAYLAVQNLKSADGRNLSSERMMIRGLELLKRIIEYILLARKGEPIRRAGDFLPGARGVMDWCRDPWFEDLSNLLEAEPEKFEGDRADADVLDVLLPAADSGEPLSVKGFVPRRPMQSALNKYWVRASGYPYFVCPYGDADLVHGTGGGDGVVYPRVFLSVDPTYRSDGRGPNLAGLGYELERAETARRRELGGGVDDRGGAARFPEGYCDNSDPWYDGRTFAWTMVDAPKSGTRLSYKNIVDMATRRHFWEVPLAKGVATLVWAGVIPERLPPDFRPVIAFDGAAPTLDTYFKALGEASLTERVLDVETPSGIDVTETIRRFPEGTCGPMRIVQITAGKNATLEELVRVRRQIVGGVRPDYTMAKLSIGVHFAEANRTDRLIRQLGENEMEALSALSTSDELVLFNSRALVFRSDESPREMGMPDPDLEILLYVAFANETLVRFSSDNSRLLDACADLDKLDSRGLRREFLKFQTAYFQQEVTRTGRGRVLFRTLTDSLDLLNHYHEVQSELDRLAGIEQQAADNRRAQADRKIEVILLVLAVVSALQTFIDLFTLGKATLVSARFLGLLGATAGILFLLFWLLMRRKR